MLTPLTVVVVAPTVSCHKSELKPIPFDVLEVDDSNTLLGFDENHQRAYQLEGYNTLTIPKDVIQLKTNCFSPQMDEEHEYDAPTVIKQINFEKDCQCLRFTNQFREFKGTNFNSLPNLEKVVFPPKYTNVKDQYLFANCPRLSVLDFSNIELDIQVERAVSLWLDYESMPNHGTIIQGKNLLLANAVCKYLADAGKTWIIK